MSIEVGDLVEVVCKESRHLGERFFVTEIFQKHTYDHNLHYHNTYYESPFKEFPETSCSIMVSFLESEIKKVYDDRHESDGVSFESMIHTMNNPKEFVVEAL